MSRARVMGRDATLNFISQLCAGEWRLRLEGAVLEIIPNYDIDGGGIWLQNDC